MTIAHCSFSWWSVCFCQQETKAKSSIASGRSCFENFLLYFHFITIFNFFFKKALKYHTFYFVLTQTLLILQSVAVRYLLSLLYFQLVTPVHLNCTKSIFPRKFEVIRFIFNGKWMELFSNRYLFVFSIHILNCRHTIAFVWRRR